MIFNFKNYKNYIFLKGNISTAQKKKDSKKAKFVKIYSYRLR